MIIHPDSVAQWILKPFVQSVFSSIFNSKVKKLPLPTPPKENKQNTTLPTYYMSRIENALFALRNLFLL